MNSFSPLPSLPEGRERERMIGLTFFGTIISLDLSRFIRDQSFSKRAAAVYLSF